MPASSDAETVTQAATETWETSAPLVELERVFQHVNGRCALNALSLSVRRGDALLLIGPNGAGKSLTLRLMLGLDQPSSGAIRLFGQDLASLTDTQMNRLRGRLGVVLQGGSLLDELTLLENLLLPMRARPRDRSALARAARLVITQLQLDGMTHHYPRALSLGQRRSAELARALINQPELLICDGLSDGLDRPALRDILGILKVQRETRGLTMVATDNAMLDVIGPEDRVLVMDRGRLLFDGTRAGLERGSSDDLELRTILEGHP
ncbi:hypothetical protein CCR96_17445 [Halochromatium roseum]|nr:hypothetical protein [Halochromatium roseum]